MKQMPSGVLKKMFWTHGPQILSYLNWFKRCKKLLKISENNVCVYTPTISSKYYFFVWNLWNQSLNIIHNFIIYVLTEWDSMRNMYFFPLIFLFSKQGNQTGGHIRNLSGEGVLDPLLRGNNVCSRLLSSELCSSLDYCHYRAVGTCSRVCCPTFQWVQRGWIVFF